MERRGRKIDEGGGEWRGGGGKGTATCSNTVLTVNRVYCPHAFILHLIVFPIVYLRVLGCMRYTPGAASTLSPVPYYIIIIIIIIIY